MGFYMGLIQMVVIGSHCHLGDSKVKVFTTETFKFVNIQIRMRVYPHFKRNYLDTEFDF